MTLTNNPETWNKLLSAAPKGAVLMGGAVRDWLCKSEAKDYDIFHTYQLGIPEIPGWTYLPRDHANEAKWEEDYQVDGVGKSPIGCVYDYDVPVDGKLLRVQLIGLHMENPTDYFKNFDHTLTLALYGSRGLYADPKLFDSVINKTVTCISDKNKIKSRRRAVKVITRHDPEGVPDWKFLNF